MTFFDGFVLPLFLVAVGLLVDGSILAEIPCLRRIWSFMYLALPNFLSHPGASHE